MNYSTGWLDRLRGMLEKGKKREVEEMIRLFAEENVWRIDYVSAAAQHIKSGDGKCSIEKVHELCEKGIAQIIYEIELQLGYTYFH